MMMTCITIDDEPLAHKVIKNYCQHLDALTIEKECHSALEAINYLSSNTVDLIFLDINMPQLKGLDFLRTLATPPMVIITTAYQEFALESYELNVMDYLLKPFSFERFLKAFNKAQNQKRLMTSAQYTQPQTNKQPPVEAYGGNNERIFIKGDKKIHQVALEDIEYLQSYGSYVKIHLKNEMVMTLDRLTHFEELLPERFIRVHRSYIVPVPKIQSIEGNQLKLSHEAIPIGNSYKQNVMKIVGGGKGGQLKG